MHKSTGGVLRIVVQANSQNIVFNLKKNTKLQHVEMCKIYEQITKVLFDHVYVSCLVRNPIVSAFSEVVKFK